MKNPIGLQTAYWQGTVPKLDIHEVIARTKAAGMDVIELKAGDFVSLTKEGRKDLCEEIRGAGLEITVNGTGLRPERDTSSPDLASREAGVKHLNFMLDLCAEMGVKYFSGIPYGLWNTRPAGKTPAEVQKAKQERLDYAAESLQQVAAHAEKVGVILCLEIVNRFEQYMMNTADEGIAFCKRIHNSNCKLLLDTFHMCIEEDYIPSAIERASEAGYLGYIHIGESNRKIPAGGQKTIPWQAIADVIAKIGFDGPLVMEPFVLNHSPAVFDISLWRPMKDEHDIDGLTADAAAGVKYLYSL